MPKQEQALFDLKCAEYAEAIEKYQTIPVYTRVEKGVSIGVVSLQIFSLFQLFLDCHSVTSGWVIVTLCLIYVATDFFNGLIHLFLDNNTNYTNLVGPYVAAFHLHHSLLRYQDNTIIKIYFEESGHKIWLVFYLGVLVLLQMLAVLPVYLNLALVSFGLLSSFAELSHYWCHNLKNRRGVIARLQKWGFLLSMHHHKVHHQTDNRHYAFLNGMTDPLINKIADFLYSGYKNHADQHVLAYRARCMK
jgi:hypothetical protein